MRHPANAGLILIRNYEWADISYLSHSVQEAEGMLQYLSLSYILLLLLLPIIIIERKREKKERETRKRKDKNKRAECFIFDA